MQDITCRRVKIIFVLTRQATLEKLPKKDPALYPA